MDSPRPKALEVSLVSRLDSARGTAPPFGVAVWVLGNNDSPSHN